MGAIYAELHVGGHVFVLRRCTYGVSQATNGRGRPIEQVRHHHVEGEMNVPRNQFMEKWAATAYMPVDGYVVFSGGPGEPAMETVSWEAGQCVFYREVFNKGSLTDGSYVCQWRIAAAKLVFSAAPPKPFVAAAPREHGTPPQGFGNPTVVIPPSLPPPVITPFEVPVAEGLGAAAARVLAGVVAAPLLVPAALTLALILAASPPAHAPGLPRLPVNPDALRLRYLEAQHAAGALTPNEEAEMILLLAKVKGIHVHSLKDLADSNAPVLPMRGGHVPLRNFTYLHDFAYTKRAPAERIKLRTQFDKKKGVREAFLLDLAKDSAKMDRLKKLGMSNDNLDRIKLGLVPKGYQVHHKLSLDDGGDNSFSNLVIMKNDPYHLSVTVFQNGATRSLVPGETQILEWPTIDDYIYPNY